MPSSPPARLRWPPPLPPCPRRPLGLAWGAALLVLLGSGLSLIRRGRGGYLFAAAALAAFPVSLAASISFLSLYFYELPTHHCPFCVLQGEHGYVGYPLFLALLTGVAAGVGVGVLMPFRHRESLAAVLPGLHRRLAVLSLSGYGLFAGLCLTQVWVSALRLYAKREGPGPGRLARRQGSWERGPGGGGPWPLLPDPLPQPHMGMGRGV